MGDELRRLPCEDKILAGLLFPAFDGIRGGCSVEYPVEFSGFELAGVILQLRLDRKVARGKRAPPRIIVPARSTDQDASHDLFRWIRSGSSAVLLLVDQPFMASWPL